MWLRRRHVGGGGGWWRPRHRMKFPPLAVPLVLILIMMSLAEGAMGIDCFKCVSVNGDNPGCEDPFNNNYTVGMLESPCMAGRKGREGLFPATACIKLAGIYDDNGQTLIIRDCTVDSGSLTLDTELARMSHCGAFVLSGRSDRREHHDKVMCSGQRWLNDRHGDRSNVSLRRILFSEEVCQGMPSELRRPRGLQRRPFADDRHPFQGSWRTPLRSLLS
ncbi:uncharacterized protein [Macrobrachium rosenbergii]|uniref:uncharacterized protein isoform X1 n=1 Tax=Macrobrachium rosenbergii TaxID=79674 RepID=UPI0034D7A6D4